MALGIAVQVRGDAVVLGEDEERGGVEPGRPDVLELAPHAFPSVLHGRDTQGRPVRYQHIGAAACQ